LIHRIPPRAFTSYQTEEQCEILLGCRPEEVCLLYLLLLCESSLRKEVQKGGRGKANKVRCKDGNDEAKKQHNRGREEKED